MNWKPKLKKLKYKDEQLEYIAKKIERFETPQAINSGLKGKLAGVEVTYLVTQFEGLIAQEEADKEAKKPKSASNKPPAAGEGKGD